MKKYGLIAPDDYIKKQNHSMPSFLFKNGIRYLILYVYFLLVFNIESLYQ